MMPSSTNGAAVITTGSAAQTAAEQAARLHRLPAFAGVDVIAVTAGTNGFLTALANPTDRWLSSEVADVFGRPVQVSWLLRTEGTAVIDATQLLTALPGTADRNLSAVATSYGLGQLLQRARSLGAHTVIVGAAGFPGADAASGALNAAGAKLAVANGSGLKVGANELAHILTFTPAEPKAQPHVILLCDTDQPLAQIAGIDDARRLFAALVNPYNPNVTPESPRTGAYDGLAFGFACAFNATLVDATGFGVQLHDPESSVRHAQLVIGGPEQIATFSRVYDTLDGRTITFTADVIGPENAREIAATFATLRKG